MRSILCLLLLILPALVLSDYNPADNIVTKWKLSTGVGYNNIKADVIGVKYDANFVYVTTNDIPSYQVGPFPRRANNPRAQNETYVFPRRAVNETEKKTKVGKGPIGLFINGQAIFGPMGKSYKNKGRWVYDANKTECIYFDNCNGHVDKHGRYHSHTNPICLYNASIACFHSPLIGYMLDGFPIYGPFGYANPFNPLSGLKRMVSSYYPRNITKRNTLSNGTPLKKKHQGPKVCDEYPLGTFIQDYEYVNRLGDLDEFNGRLCVTPE
jgi:hypothetical protein